VEGVGLPGLFLVAAAGVAVDGALFVAGGAVLFLRGDGGQIGDVVLGGHGDGPEEETGEGGMAVEDVAALGVDVEDVERWWGRGGGLFCEVGFDVAEESFQDGGFEGWKRKATKGVAGSSKVRASWWRSWVGARGGAVGSSSWVATK
jgi:hypothetical protein